jgi:hypothetical protein
VVGCEVSKQPPWSIATSTITERGFIIPSISRVTRCGATAGDQNGADDDVRFAEFLLEDERVGHQDPGSRPEVLVELVQSIERAFEDRHLPVGAEGDACRPCPDDATADHEDRAGQRR